MGLRRGVVSNWAVTRHRGRPFFAASRTARYATLQGRGIPHAHARLPATAAVELCASDGHLRRGHFTRSQLGGRAHQHGRLSFHRDFLCYGRSPRLLMARRGAFLSSEPGAATKAASLLLTAGLTRTTRPRPLARAPDGADLACVGAF